jgi:hypothetical protein
MYHHFNNKKLYVLPTQCIYVFRMDLRTNCHSSWSFHPRRYDRYVVPKRRCLTNPKDGSIQVNRSVSLRSRIAVIDLSSINCVVFTTETHCVYCAVGTESLNVMQVNPSDSLHGALTTARTMDQDMEDG